MPRTHLTEHPEAKVPTFITSHPHFVDESWHNDVCPCFRYSPDGENRDDTYVLLWVDYPTAEQSDFHVDVRPEAPYKRYLVSTQDGHDDHGRYATFEEAFEVIVAKHAEMRSAEQDKADRTRACIEDVRKKLDVLSGEILVKHFPEAESGDVSPHAVFTFADAVELMVRDWVDGNVQ